MTPPRPARSGPGRRGRPARGRPAGQPGGLDHRPAARHHRHGAAATASGATGDVAIAARMNAVLSRRRNPATFADTAAPVGRLGTRRSLGVWKSWQPAFSAFSSCRSRPERQTSSELSYVSPAFPPEALGTSERTVHRYLQTCRYVSHLAVAKRRRVGSSHRCRGAQWKKVRG